MPNFIGDWFPRNDIEELRDLYCMSILALFCPWTDIRDLVGEGQTISEAFAVFVRHADDRLLDIMDNIQYQYERCDCSERKKRDAERAMQNDIRTIDPNMDGPMMASSSQPIDSPDDPMEIFDSEASVFRQVVRRCCDEHSHR